jgi:transcription elongation factor Elf1
MPYVSPYPFDCPECSAEVTENEEEKKVVHRNKYRIIHIQCDSCGEENKMKQRPILPDVELVEE